MKAFITIIGSPSSSLPESATPSPTPNIDRYVLAMLDRQVRQSEQELPAPVLQFK